MKLKIRRSNTFKKDVERACKRGFDVKELEVVIGKLRNCEKLDEKYRDHPLVGNYNDYRNVIFGQIGS